MIKDIYQRSMRIQ